MAKQDIHIYVGQRLRLRRTTMGLSQAMLGNAAGITFQQVQKYEKGANALNASRLYEFSQFLRVPVAYFFDGLEQPPSAFSPPGLATMAVSETQGDSANHHHKPVSDRESLEMMKAFQRIKQQSIRVQLARLARTIADA